MPDTTTQATARVPCRRDYDDHIRIECNKDTNTFTVVFVGEPHSGKANPGKANLILYVCPTEPCGPRSGRG